MSVGGPSFGICTASPGWAWLTDPPAFQVTVLLLAVGGIIVTHPGPWGKQVRL